jgi:hypothetical protein
MWAHSRGPHPLLSNTAHTHVQKKSRTHVVRWNRQRKRAASSVVWWAEADGAERVREETSNRHNLHV